MNMQTARVAIVGAGIAGLYAAFILEQRGVTDYILLDARNRVGGRTESRDGIDLGPAWFWPALQLQLDGLVEALGLERFDQYETGDSMIERSPDDVPRRVRSYPSSPPSVRLAGGMSALVDAVRCGIAPSRMATDQRVLRLRRNEQLVEVEAEDAHDKVRIHPPRADVAAGG